MRYTDFANEAGIAILLLIASVFILDVSSLQTEDPSFDPMVNAEHHSDGTMNIDAVVRVHNLPPTIDIHILRKSNSDYEISLHPDDPNSIYDLRRLTFSLARNGNPQGSCILTYRKMSIVEVRGWIKPIIKSDSEIVFDLIDLKPGTYSIQCTIEDEDDSSTIRTDFSIKR